MEYKHPGYLDHQGRWARRVCAAKWGQARGDESLSVSFDTVFRTYKQEVIDHG
jgi:hypothetical protein